MPDSDKDGDGIVTPEVVFATKAEYTESVQRHVNAALAPKLRKVSEAEERIGALEAELAELRSVAERAPAEQAKGWEAERTQLQRQHEALRGELEQSDARAKSLQARWHDSYRTAMLTDLAVQCGAAKSAVHDIPVLFPKEMLQIEDSENGGLRATMRDPTTGLPKDATETMRAWLASRPHLLDAPAGGSGSRGSGAPKAVTNDPLAGKYGADAFIAAFHPQAVGK